MKNPIRLKIAYLCDLSPLESWTYSSGNAQIYHALQNYVGDVEILDNQWFGVEFMRKILDHLPEALTLRLRWRLHLLLARLIARGVNKQLVSGKFDVLFCPYSFHSLAGLGKNTDILTVFTSDATPSTYKRSEIGASFGSFFAPSRLFDRLVLRAETRVLNQTDLNLWPSEWQKTAADTLYGLDRDTSIVVPWGANIQTPGKPRDWLTIDRNGPIRLLLVGRDWYAKGGPMAIEVLNSLLAAGTDAHLTVVGCTPPAHHMGENITVHASLDKADDREFTLFEQLFKNSHFMIMPSFEAYGFAFCEASAYGLPSLCLRVGGVPIKDGINGHALKLAATAAEFSQQILHYADHPDAYMKLRASSRKYFETTLNWGVWGQKVARLIEQKLTARKPR